MTGMYNSRFFFLEPSALFSSNYGKVLFIKILLVIATIIVYIMHTRLLNIEIERKLTDEKTGSVFILSVRSKVLYLGRITVILSVAILLAATLLVSGGLSVSDDKNISAVIFIMRSPLPARDIYTYSILLST